jgi:uncharacterized membrane protein YebE (DUF533 family)
MSNSTTVAATIGVSALGVLAYYGYQNLNGNKVDEATLYNELDGEKDTSFQDEAKKEVAKVITATNNAWGSFWKGEYGSIDAKNVKVELTEDSK